MKKKPKIALIIDYHPLPAGGMEVHANEIYKTLKRHKELDLQAVVGFSSEKKELNHIDKTVVLPKEGTFDPEVLSKLIKKLKFEEGDVLLFNSLYWIRIISELKARFPKMVFLLRSGGNDIAQSQITGKGKTLEERRSFVVNTINKSVDFLIVNSNYSYRKLNGFGLNKKKMAIVTGGVDTEKFKPVSSSNKKKLRKKLGLPADKVIILSSCRLVRFKGIEYVLKAIYQSNNKDSIHYLLVGDGSEKEKIMRLAHNLGIQDSITMTGEVSMESIHQYYQLSDIYCHAPILTRNYVLGGSYIHTETMGRSFCEAMSAGLPTVATDVGGVSDVVKEKEGGVLVPPKEIHTLKKEIESLVSSKSKRQKMGLQARKNAKKFSWENVSKNYSLLIKNKNDE